MHRLLVIQLSLLTSLFLTAQEEILPRGYSLNELERIARGDYTTAPPARGNTSPPEFDHLRTMAEWEEIQALTIAWSSYPAILKRIISAAKTEAEVVILSTNTQQTSSYLQSNQGAPALPDLDNVTLLPAAYNSVWIRDYGANSVYADDVGELFLVDWRYNRITRPEDDASPQFVADYLGLDLYSMIEAPTDLVNTGGNWMSDGFGTAFASELVLEENAPGNLLGVTPKTASEIDAMLGAFQGTHTYIKMTPLEFDNIHHIDMHMKLLDEQTILVGEFPEGISDGPQINANIEYVLSNFQTKWNTPFNIIRIPMPDSPSGLWPGSQPQSAHYRTYTNSVFVNNKIIVPVYREQYDTTALRIYQEALPGYEIIPIDCDNQPEVIIAASGALHCITHSVGVQDPLLISHLPLSDTEDSQNDYPVVAWINHRDGIATASVFWKSTLEGSYNEAPMIPIGNYNWTALIPAHEPGTKIYYYIQAEAQSGKQQTRPMPAPEGYWTFTVLGDVTLGILSNPNAVQFGTIFPNPANAITCVPIFLTATTSGKLSLMDSTGREVKMIQNGHFPVGESRHFFDASLLAPGIYRAVFRTEYSMHSAPLMIR